jgi:hypothetical protein
MPWQLCRYGRLRIFPSGRRERDLTWEAPMFAVRLVKYIFNHPSCCFGEGHRSRAGGQFIFPFALLSGI